VTLLAGESPKRVPGIQAVPERPRNGRFGERRSPCRARCRGLDCTVAGAVALKSRHRAASRLGVCTPKRTDGEERASRSPTEAVDQRRILSIPSPDGGGCSRWRASLCGRGAERQLPRKRRGPGGTTHKEQRRTLRRTHHEGGPAATGCQRITHEERCGCRAGTSVDRQTCPQKRVFKSFP